MKKSLILSGIMSILFLGATSAFADTQDTKTQYIGKKTCPCVKPMPIKMDKPKIDERLNLTEEQKKQAHEIRMQGHEKMKPIFKEMQAKKQEIRKIRDSELSQEEKDLKIAPLKNELKKLAQDAKKVRMENTKEFESILTDEQKAEFAKIKNEGKQRAKQYRKQAKRYNNN